MQRFSHIRTAYKLLIGFGLGLLLIALLSALIVARLTRLNAISHELVIDPLPGTAAIAQITSHIKQYRIDELREVLTGARADESLQKQYDVIQGDLDYYESTITKADDRRNFGSLKALWAQYRAAHEHVLELHHSGDHAAASAFLLLGPPNDTFSELEALLEKMIAWNRDDGERLARLSISTFRSARAIVFCTLAVMFLLGLLALFFNRSVERAVFRLAETAEDVARGRIDARMPVEGPQEIASVARAFNAMLEARNEAEHAVRDLNSDLERRVHERTQELEQSNEQLARASEAAEAANRAKSAFLANMSHELRTPLNAVIGYSDMLLEEAEDRELEDLTPDIKKINAAGKHLLELINAVLDLSKIEAGKMELYLEPFSTREMVNGVAAIIKPLVTKNGNQFQLEMPSDLGTMVADLTKVRQSLLNLLSNACKFTDHGQITLSVWRETADGQERACFRVKDNGIGMTEQQQQRLFAEFMQADTSTTRKYGGTGLGLAISRRFCRMMGGDILVKSRPGEGSEFLMVLPLTVRDASKEVVIHAPDTASDVPAQPEAGTVLIIDDDATARELLGRSLSREGYRVVTASGGSEGLQMARELHPDAITLDVLMPQTDGWSVLAALKADPALADIAVVMVTMVDDRNLGFALGAADYLTKPVDHTQLARVLARYRKADSGRVLIVDDDPDAREMVRRILEKEGWSIAEAENGRIGLERVQERRPDLIVLDLTMPEMDGFEFVDVLKRNPDWESIPVIVVTAKDITREDQVRLNSYVERILSKGAYSIEDLLHETHRLIKARVGQS
jgi:signal transduction histidine kinase/CheY-like chemotaxis protein